MIKDVKCLQCGKEFLKPKISIAGRISGNERIDSFYYCEDCQLYTIETFWDEFMGDDSNSFRGPIPKEEGDKQVEFLNQCKDRGNKICRCEIHKGYFGPSLD